MQTRRSTSGEDVCDDGRTANGFPWTVHAGAVLRLAGTRATVPLSLFVWFEFIHYAVGFLACLMFPSTVLESYLPSDADSTSAAAIAVLRGPLSAIYAGLGVAFWAALMTNVPTQTPETERQRMQLLLLLSVAMTAFFGQLVMADLFWLFCGAQGCHVAKLGTAAVHAGLLYMYAPAALAAIKGRLILDSGDYGHSKR